MAFGTARVAPHTPPHLTLKVLETERLILRWLDADDAPFILELLNDPLWIEFIGDRGVRTVNAARDYIMQGPVAMYQQFGFGLYLTELKASRTPIGLCGLIKRKDLDDVDIGFALLPPYRAYGYAYEASAAVIVYGCDRFHLRRIVAIASPANAASTRLLEKLGLRFERKFTLPGDDEELNFFASDVGGSKVSDVAESRPRC